jgi:hypothetical protein
MQLERIYDAAQLSKSKVYQFNGTLYRFSCKCPYARIDHPQWLFEPMPGQRSRATLKLNSSKIRSGCLTEVVGLVAGRKSEVTPQGIQQVLF